MYLSHHFLVTHAADIAPILLLDVGFYLCSIKISQFYAVRLISILILVSWLYVLQQSNFLWKILEILGNSTCRRAWRATVHVGPQKPNMIEWLSRHIWVSNISSREKNMYTTNLPIITWKQQTAKRLENKIFSWVTMWLTKWN